jgi:thioredoxin reductase
MTAPVELALVGKMRFAEEQKEALLEFWHGVVRQTGLASSFRERMEAVVAQDGGFLVQTNKGSYKARSVLLTIGRRGTARKLGVPGEERSKVVYRLIDPAQYEGQSVLVVGGGDSALEAATALAEQPSAEVVLSYRSDAFSRVKAKNRQWMESLQAQGRLRVMLGSQVRSIEDNMVSIEERGQIVKMLNHAVIVCTGGELPTPLLQRMSVHFDTEHGAA